MAGERAPLPEAVRPCAGLHRSLVDCHRKVKDPIQRDAFCRHLNRRLATCLVSTACPDEAEAVRVMCSSAGTSAKRAQCQEAKVRLGACLSSLQEPD